MSGVDPQPSGTKAWGVLSVWERLIEFKLGNGFWIGGVEMAGLVESEFRLGWGAGGGHARRPTGKIEVGEDRANGNGIRNEGDDADRTTPTTLRAVPGQTSGSTS